MCVLVNGELQCTDYHDNQMQVFSELNKCEEQAEYRFYAMTDTFLRMNIPFESIKIGCRTDDDL